MARLRTRTFGALAVVLTTSAAYVSCGPTETDDDTVRAVALALQGHLTGAVFTTTIDGSRVNANLYPAKEDVYLDGGPGMNAPAKAAGLPEGDYYYQVTDPSGKDLLSTDHISCRKVHVNESGVIDTVYPGTNYEWQAGGFQTVACQHAQGTDQDHPELGAVTVQLYPYDDTPNPGGVYKVWMTRTEDYAGDPNLVPDKKRDGVNGEGWQPANAHGFVPAFSKTDNFKVEQKGKPCDPPGLTVLKFHDENLDGVRGLGEAEISGWGMNVADPTGTSNQYYTPVSLVASVGDWAVVEDEPAGTMQTVSRLDGVTMSAYPDANPVVMVTFTNECSAEQHEVVYGNVGAGSVAACKVYDRNADGVADDSEPGVPGWKMTLAGTDVTGAQVGPMEGTTGADGCTTFEDLLPGEYQVTEVIPETGGWNATGPTETTVTVESTLDGGVLMGTQVEHAFTNVCTGSAAFGTKGYWHNKNGLTEMTDADIAFVNGLAPYATESSYFDAGDEPFDGLFTDGTAVAAAFNNMGEELAPAGSARAEVSQFLVDTNAGADPREQLAQQFLAFLFNAQNRLDPGASIRVPDGEFRSIDAVTTFVVAVWESEDVQLQIAVAEALDAYNNSDAVEYIKGEPCDVTYP